MSASSGLRVFLGMPAIVASRRMRALLEVVERVARTSAAVLIGGESGTGKEVIARAVHHYSLRCSKPWVDVSCAALPEHLVESELFGYDKGAFSGADSGKPGLFELAHTGTLFLDEIGELDAKLQVKLLRVLDGAPYYRLGGVRKVSVDVRIVAATNQDLPRAIREGRFREDLYHRLNQVRLDVPPLRERPEDVEALARFFLEQQGGGRELAPDALAAIRGYGWPGNARELRNAMVRAAALADGPAIRAADLPAGVFAGPVREAPVALPDNLCGLERRTILEVLEKAGGHHRRAAEMLGISTRTLTRKLKVYAVGERCASLVQ
jgi:transcriptional regulator with PAS, ATPase and Fis domain